MSWFGKFTFNMKYLLYHHDHIGFNQHQNKDKMNIKCIFTQLIRLLHKINIYNNEICSVKICSHIIMELNWIVFIDYCNLGFLKNICCDVPSQIACWRWANITKWLAPLDVCLCWKMYVSPMLGQVRTANCCVMIIKPTLVWYWRSNCYFNVSRPTMARCWWTNC